MSDTPLLCVYLCVYPKKECYFYRLKIDYVTAVNVNAVITVSHPGRFTVSGSIRSIKMYGWG
jgi:hypothetical protein